MVHRKSRGGTSPLTLKIGHNEITWYRGKQPGETSTVISLSEDFYQRAIFNCISFALQFEWFAKHTQQTQSGRLSKVKHFFRWLQNENYIIEEGNKYFLLKDYASYNTHSNSTNGFDPIFPDTCYHLTHYWYAAADIPVASDNPAHYADAIRYNARTLPQGSLLPLTRLVWA